MKWIWRFHKWYDRLPETRRFLLFLALVTPVITPTIWVNSAATALVWLTYSVLMLAPRAYLWHTRGSRARKRIA